MQCIQPKELVDVGIYCVNQSDRIVPDDQSEILATQSFVPVRSQLWYILVEQWYILLPVDPDTHSELDNSFRQLAASLPPTHVFWQWNYMLPVIVMASVAYF